MPTDNIPLIDDAQQTPDQRLATLIADALIKEGLFPADEKQDFEEKLAGGEMTAAKWAEWVVRKPATTAKDEEGDDASN